MGSSWAPVEPRLCGMPVARLRLRFITRLQKGQNGLLFFILYLAGIYPISVHARNNISSADASSIIRILDPVSLAWLKKPPSVVNVGVRWNASVIVNGTNVTVSVSYGDGSPVNETFIESAENTEIIFWHE